MKIIEKIRAKEEANEKYFSLEFFPPRTDAGCANLLARLQRMSQLGPLFLDITWGAGGKTAQRTQVIAQGAQSYVGVETMMHLTCTNQSVESVKEALKEARKAGIQNILALRGDPADGSEEWTAADTQLRYAADLVRLIREEHGDYFGIAVAGYPSGHPEAESYEADLDNLKAKVDAGADFVVTQLFFDAAIFLKFRDDCVARGINVPIVPGLLPIQSYASLRHLSKMASTPIPVEITEAVEAVKNDDRAVRDFGVTKAVEMIQELWAGGVSGVHFYTLNREVATSQIVEALELVCPPPRELPWKCINTVPKRAVEDVRPIFWSNRPESYLLRTSEWDDFPNGRWGDSSSPAFGEISDYHLFHLEPAFKVDEHRAMWGEAPKTIADLAAVFVAFCEGRIRALPWISDALADETTVIADDLIALNRAGVFTINSQPAVNGLSSDDPVHGWGGSGGYVYQKAYIEAFVSPTVLAALEALMPKYPTLQYHALNAASDDLHTNVKTQGAVAVTWGVFPAKEIIQPTVVDVDAFYQWKDEAFKLWLSRWKRLYADGSPSAALIQSVHDNYYLINIVDNDYVNGDIFAVFRELLTPDALAAAPSS
ncbi:methylenetetrahydrofolate reductase [Thecamonas trahens ATCC 50062]|uniref:methylenetetrahydrofolate reductase (NADH) n=1 Tax=Thecamonas trahens ATCC 50062 TaxID=461836 RepID=A0A0L0DMH8_THETB|nr:methylenetetrahydrofolate reductase [Thecamonas trahens ATCC 50062]KNC53226.1 methylenetetrahydrofolate reductase [Thecamonas trahens ATCC 50062]|eukprot:XP_013754695.1 methylenetetrahydrofolate reductase [Thecamonas trahens ATCC 50062]